MTEKRFRVHELVKYDYSEIGEYIDENHTDSPLRNDVIVDLLNNLHEENQDLKSFNEDLAENLSVCANARILKDTRIEKLTEENERLKHSIKCLEADKMELQQYIKRMQGDVE